jgi:hypothetical protein
MLLGRGEQGAMSGEQGTGNYKQLGVNSHRFKNLIFLVPQKISGLNLKAESATP